MILLKLRLSLISIPDDKAFLYDQRNERKGYMTGTDVKLPEEKRKIEKDKTDRIKSN